VTHVQWNDSSALHTFAIEIVSKLQRAGFTAYFAGGCVRDALMGNQPHDYDVATNATLADVTQIFGARHTLAIGAAFGVACVHGKVQGERHQVEVATFRSDGKYTDGRHPDSVTFSSPEEDAKRRDFTINGMFFDPLNNSLKDYVGGEQDLAIGTIRAIGAPEQRIDEDKLRMLRAVRFSARFGFEIEPKTALAISHHAEQIRMVSGERIAVEMRKLLESARPGWGLHRLYELRLLGELMPDVATAWSDSAIRERTIAWIERLRDRGSFASRLAAMLSSCEMEGDKRRKREVLRLKEAWKLSNNDASSIEFALMHAKDLLNAHALPWSLIQPMLIAEESWAGVELARAFAEQQGQALDGLEHCERALGWPRERLDPPRLLTGMDLQSLGFQPGPKFAEILREARAKQLDGEFQTPEEAITWARHQSR
jgi:tRNA nucleotidyltransferase/poly(A) polymerase